MSTPPELSVVIVTPHDFAQIRRSVRHVREQDLAERTELLVVCTRESAVADARASELTGFHGVRFVPVGAIDNVDHAATHGVLAARAPVVAIVEDHAYVQPGWARAIVDAYTTGPWVSVGSVMENANPRRSLSWANLLLGYGWWIDPAAAGEMHDVPSHNGTYRTAVLQAFGDDLVTHVGRDGDLHDLLRADGGRMYLAHEARVAHANPSRLAPTADLRVNAGRLYGCERAEQAGWSDLKRAIYIALAPLIPVVRLRRLRGEHLVEGRHHHQLRRRILPGLLVALLLDAWGQVLGYLGRPGPAKQVLATFEMDRMQHLTRSDVAALTDAVPPA